ncbi:MAG TPA: peptidase S41 [Bacteroidales bacterium]|nr:peptidase S41 [Bacteroidales bacterium]
MRNKTLLAALFIFSNLVGFAQGNSPLWLRYPAISPDGSTIAFSYKGDIYKVSSKGGVASIVTTNSAYDYMPVWSPDGKQLAFASNRYGNFDIFIVAAEGGTPTRLTFYSSGEYPWAFTNDGKNIIYSSQQQDNFKNILFPSGLLTELYSIPVDGGRPTQILTTPAENVNVSTNGNLLAYQDKKGYEDPWRKHHTSAVTRDIWIYDTQSGKHKKISIFSGEDRNPIFSNDSKSIYYLTEQWGSFNVALVNIDGGEPKQVSFFDKHPVRFLSKSTNDILCFQYNGEIYTQPIGSNPQKVNVSILADQTETAVKYESLTKGATEMSISPDGKEIAFIIRGDVFVTSSDFVTTKRITKTPEQERTVSFSPDGKKLLYASERDGSWKIYQSSIISKDEPNFSLSTLLKEEPIVAENYEAFQPLYSPDGKEVAFLKDRTTLCVINLNTKQVRTVLDGKYNYSYSDGDQYYQWSPDSKWFAVNFNEHSLWIDSEVGLVNADGSGKFENLTKSGYADNNPKWMMGGKAIIWFNDRMGMRSHGSWGSQYDVYGMFLTQEAFDEFKLTKQEAELLKDKKKKEKEDKEKADKEKDKEAKDKDAKGKEEKKKSEIEPLKFELDNIDDRKVRLTINSSNISDAILSPEGDKLYYLSRFEKGFDLWVRNIKDNETKLLLKIDGFAGDMQMDKDGKNIYMLSGGSLMKVEISSNKQTNINFKAEFDINYPVERDYLFEHIWRQIGKKFYDVKLHNVDWKFYKSEYSRFLPNINNNFDFAEMVSEMLGELNGSHTGCRYSPSFENADRTASLGLFYDNSYPGNGLKIAEIMDKSPVIDAKSKIKTGTIIEKIDGSEIIAGKDYFSLLNRKAGKQVLLDLLNPATGEKWVETVKPISTGEENELLYQRWVDNCKKETERLSNGRLGYIHVRGMNSESFREVYSELLGRYVGKEAIIIDTRFNGGGWLHDDLATLLSGKRYADYYPHGQYMGSEPIAKWSKPSIVLVGEGNYSDAHAFPYTYKTLNIGKLVGMPVPGTMTAVWWETQQDPTLVFGIPQIGVKDMNGKYLENQQIEPDIKVPISPEEAANGIDTQLKAAVEDLLKQLDAQKK